MDDWSHFSGEGNESFVCILNIGVYNPTLYQHFPPKVQFNKICVNFLNKMCHTRAFFRIGIAP